MKLILFSTTAASCLVALVDKAHGHGYVSSPITRNYYSNQFGLDWGTAAGVPLKEYCPHCLNIKGPESVCGTSGQGVNYDEWVDSLQQPMPWNSNGNVYGEGDVITVSSVLTAHHMGHMELRACPKGRASTQECFDKHVLEFMEDTAYNMPKDENHPERGYYYGSEGYQADKGFSMKFRLPQGLVGQEVLLQWVYVSANSCSPEGYVDYYGSNQDLQQDWFNPQLRVCTPDDFPPEFIPSPERFVNCAEITILSTGENPVSPPVAAPIAPAPSPVAAPVPSPTEPVDPNGIGTCGGGNRGNGICPDQSMCCSEWGWCGNTAEHCDESNPVPSPVSLPDPSPVETPPTDIHTNGDSRLIAYLGNWQGCPTDEQMAQYTHIVIAFAVSYTWSPGKNSCSETCEIATPPVCDNSPQPDLIQKWKNAGKKIILSFGGAGMGGSWAGDANDCWDYCFGRETQVVSRLTEIVNDMGLDGVDIDYEYFYEDYQHGSGFTKGAQAQKFLKDVTVGLRNTLPAGSELTHAPMEPNMEPGEAYFELLKEISSTLDFLMPQYYNGYVYPYSDFNGALSHFTTLTNELFEGDASKVVFGFCISDCGNFNLDGYQSADVMEKLTEAYPCNGGAFFWVTNHDVDGDWSKPVKEQLDVNSMACPNTEPTNECANQMKDGWDDKKKKKKCKKINGCQWNKNNKECEVASPSICDSKSGKSECNSEPGCSMYKKSKGDGKKCHDAPVTKKCRKYTKNKCEKKGCVWNNDEDMCEGRWD